MKKMVAILIGVIAVTLVVTSTLQAEKYAVLMSAQFSTRDNAPKNSEFWYDMLLMYNTLIDEGYAHENIFVLYGAESDFQSQLACYQNPYENPVTDMMVSPDAIQDVFTYLNAIMTDDDFLFVWYMGHGKRDQGHLKFKIVNQLGTVSILDEDMAAMINTVQHYRQRVLSFMTCFSGGILDDLGGRNTIIFTSATDSEPSASVIACDTFHAEYHYYETAALHWQTPCYQCGPVDADESGNAFISFQESFDFAREGTSRSSPQLKDEGRIAPYTYLNMFPLRVSPDGSGDYPSIQAAITAAIDDNLILLDNGTYFEQDISFMGKAIAVWPESDVSDSCIIDCSDAGVGFIFDSGEGSRSLLRSVTITNGHTNTSGGGILCDNSSPTIRKCRMINNHANENGGGISVLNSSPTLHTCSLTTNHADSTGGGIYSYNSSPSFISCTVADNVASSAGGGICLSGSSSPSSEQTIFWGNSAQYIGDEVFLDIGTSMTFECSDVNPLGVAGGGLPIWGSYNVFTDPLFCGESNEEPYTINEYSPCAPENNPYCGLIGAWPVGCGDLELGILPLNGQEFYPGETIQFQVWLTNYTDSFLPVITYIDASNVPSWQIILFGPFSLNVPPHTTLGPVNLSQRIPPAAPPMTVYICITANDVSDCYPITIH